MKQELGERDLILAAALHQEQPIITADDVRQLQSLANIDRECVDAIDIAARHQTIVSNGVLEGAKLDSGQMLLAQMPFDMIATCRFIIKMLKPQADAHHILITCEHESKEEMWIVGQTHGPEHAARG